MIKAWVILNKKTGEQFVTHNSKCAWYKPNYATSAFRLHTGTKFSEQGEWELINLGDYYKESKSSNPCP